MKYFTDRTALRIVGILFLITAVGAIIEFAISFSQNRIFLPWGVLGVPVFFGLLMHRRKWRIVALCLLMIPLIVFPFVGGTALFTGAPKYITIFGLKIAQVEAWFFFFWIALFWLIKFWEFRVLCRPTIRESFRDVSNTTAP